MHGALLACKCSERRTAYLGCLSTGSRASTRRTRQTRSALQINGLVGLRLLSEENSVLNRNLIKNLNYNN